MTSSLEPRAELGAVRTDGGSSTPALVFGAGLALLVFVGLANLIIIQYGLGVAQGALDEGARVGALAGGRLEVCEAVVADVLANLLAGPLGEDVSVSCVHEGDVVVASAGGSFRFWLPGPPPWRFRLEAAAAVEPEP